MDVITRRLPDRITRTTKILAWATLISNIGIILTGGAVRLTDSGLGCPEWPRCTADSWVSTPEMGIHGAIEFGNRMLTYVLIAISVAMFLTVVRLWSTHRSLVVRTLIIGFGIPLQGVIGGITVWTNLNPWVVALHFLASAGLVMVATGLLVRINLELAHAGQPGQSVVDGEHDAATRQLAAIVLTASWIAVVLGTVVTGTGPHAGDPGSPRHEFNAELVTRLHVIPVYVLCAAAVFLAIRQFRLRTSTAQRRSVWFLIAVILAQGTIGYWQHWTGLPILLVWLHMLGSAVLIVAATLVFDRYLGHYRTRGLTTQASASTPG
ncbi:COX15/CtaA family protein [Nesterenkonia ebinurensis]|uniref:COX15/CtaA family protein n=1 Tax=Nesterenkonia ebinurensis TaxID=2608252 RepID=UPI00123D9C33|nr:COX15/CtaA family protein [Nesterenkonia ebinurensis]